MQEKQVGFVGGVEGVLGGRGVVLGFVVAPTVLAFFVVEVG